MKKERHSHGGYLDFIIYVGAPNTLLTDNAKTEIGKKWTKTSRQHAVAQKNLVPHNQHQNRAEPKVGLVKNRTILTLRKSRAPVDFWCYCLMFIIVCLNHTAEQ